MRGQHDGEGEEDTCGDTLVAQPHDDLLEGDGRDDLLAMRPLIEGAFCDPGVPPVAGRPATRLVNGTTVLTWNRRTNDSRDQNLTRAPEGGRAISTAAGGGRSAGDAALSGSSARTFVANIPKELIQGLEQAGFVRVTTTGPERAVVGQPDE